MTVVIRKTRQYCNGWRRGMICALVAALLLATGALVSPVAVVRAATPMTYTVNRFADDKTDATCASLPTGCTLREAVNASNANDPGTGNANTITFAADGTTTLLAASGGTLTPTHDVTIDATTPLHTVAISGNDAVRLFVVNSGVTLSLRGLTVSGGYNSGSGGGTAGAISNNGTVNITGSTFTGNSVSTDGIGGAISNNAGGTLTITNSTFASNNAPNGIGGAVFNDANGTLNITGSTFSGNTAGYMGGGGIYNNANAGAFSITLSVIANNVALGAPNLKSYVADAIGGNVSDDSTGSTLTNSSDRLNVPAVLGTLGNYGGTVQTVPLLPGSPALDILACPNGLTTDARGVARPQPAGGNCDAGAFESHGFAVSGVMGSGQTEAVGTAFANPTSLTVTNAYSEPVAGGQVTFTITPGNGGASATFGTATGCSVTGGTVAVCTVDGGGVVTAPTLTANTVPGTFTVVATAYGVPTTTYTETSIPGPAASFTVSGYPLGVTAGTSNSATVTAKDQFGNTAPSYTSTVRITSSDSAATLPANASLTNGVGVFHITLNTAGTQSITATDTITSTITGSETGIQVVQAPLALGPVTIGGSGPGAPYHQQFIATGGAGGYTYSLASGSHLPSGLMLNSGTGALTGTAPTAPGSYTFTVQVTDSAMNTTARAYTVIVAVPNATPAPATTAAATGVPTIAPTKHTPAPTPLPAMGTLQPQPVRH